MIFRRRRFADVIERQFRLFVDEDGDLLEDVERALEAYDAAERDEAEELYGDYLLAVEAAAERLAELRDTYARTLAGDEAETYADEFNRAVAKRWRRLALAIENA